MRDVSRASHKVTAWQATALDMKKSLLEDRRTFWIVAAVSILLFGVANLPWQLDDYDQAKQAFTSFEMIKQGHWFYQRTPREHVATKPPLAGWVSAGFFALTRSWDAAWRLPSFLAAIGTMVLLLRVADLAYGWLTAVTAFSAFGLNLLTPHLATLVRTDMLLAFVIFLIGLLIWEKILAETAWRPRDRVYLFALLTAAMLIKGPIVYAFLLPGIALFQWRAHGGTRAVVSLLSRRRRSGGPQSAEQPRADMLFSAWPGWWPWAASLGVFLLWVTGGIFFQPGFFHEVVMREFVARFGETIHRPQPLYFYLPHLSHKFVPWSVLMIAMALADLHSRRWRLRSIFREMSPETFWLFCWSLGGLVAMSLIPSKRVDRVFPVVPPLCLLLAAQIGVRDAVHRHSLKPYLAATLALSILFTGGYTISKAISGYLDHRDALAVFCGKVRHEAEAHRWRYEVVSAKDEGLLLYLRRTHFIKPDQAVAEWNRGNLDALVVSTEKAPTLMRDLPDAALSQVRSNERKEEQGRDYVLITCSKAGSTFQRMILVSPKRVADGFPYRKTNLGSRWNFRKKN